MNVSSNFSDHVYYQPWTQTIPSYILTGICVLSSLVITGYQVCPEFSSLLELYVVD
jgi:hypothetical protein